MPARHLRFAQRGFSLIEVLVAITILMVGVLGVVAMVDGANAVTSKNKGREGATSLARSIIEVGRAVRYRDLTATQLIAALEGRPGLDDARPSAGHTIESRGFFYDVSVEVCSMDDETDGLGLAEPAIPFCPQSVPAVSAAAADDRNPDDYKRLAVTLSWKRGSATETTKQTSLVSNPVGGLGPSVASLTASGFSGTSVNVTSAGTTELDFRVITTSDAAQVNWSINGAPQGKATPIGSSERDFDFSWDLDGGPDTQYWYDCTYVVKADAYDDQGRSGKPGAVTVVLNRRQPFAPQFFEGGRNGNGSRVDLTWNANPECDVLGYRVYRRVGVSGSWGQVTCAGQAAPQYTTATECLDESAPAAGPNPVFYRVAAVDGSGDGDFSPELELVEGNAVPTAPSNLSACLGGTPDCFDSNGEIASDQATVVRWDASTDPDGDDILFYRVYRDGTTYGHRYSVFFPSDTGDLAWTDPATPDGQGTHTYRLTAVDVNYRESPLSDPVDFPVAP